MGIWNQQTLSEASSHFELRTYRLQSAKVDSELRSLVDSESELQILKVVLGHQVEPFAAFENPSFWQSRFRKAHEPGVYYAAAQIETAMAETGFHRHRFLADSTALSSLCLTMVQVTADVNATLVDVEKLPNQEPLYLKTDYTPCQTLAQSVRSEGIAGVHYLSVRCQKQGSAFAIFDQESLTASEQDPQFFIATITPARVEFRTASDIYELDTSTWS